MFILAPAFAGLWVKLKSTEACVITETFEGQHVDQKALDKYDWERKEQASESGPTQRGCCRSNMTRRHNKSKQPLEPTIKIPLAYIKINERYNAQQ